MSPEQLAARIGSDYTALLARLREGARTLTRSRKVSDWRFDFEAKTLSSPDGRFRVQWTLRTYPDLPENYNNQQTSVGVCYLIDPS